MANIIRLHGDPHQQIETLLPWYVNGTLDAEETALVEGHLAECAACRAELEAEKALAVDIAALPPEADQSWSALRAQVEAPSPVRRLRDGRSLLRRPVAIGWALAAQAASLAAVGAVLWLAVNPVKPAYHALSAPAAAAPGNVVVIFKPTTSEQDLRAVLQQSHARLVDGPTASDAYVLHVASNERPAALSKLRADAHIVLAEPIDGDTQP